MKFVPKKLKTFSKKDLPSPSRYWCDLFWHSLPFDLICKEGIRAVEVGCGTGVYGNFIKSKSSFVSYIGLDIKKKKIWNNRSKKNIVFYEDSCFNICKYLSNANFLFTQSSLEHFDEDLDFHYLVRDYINNKVTKKKFFQLHLVPGAQCLSSYLAHGYRHFTKNTISKITSIYDDDSKFILFELGSLNCWLLHIKYITLPRLFSFLPSRQYNRNIYLKKLDLAVQKDIQNLKTSKPAFYALMILSNYSSEDVSKVIKHYK
jgi:hypothetical protein